MKVYRWLPVALLAVSVVACGSSDEQTADKDAAPVVMPEVVGTPLDQALGVIKDAGFTDEVTIEGGGTFGVVEEANWQVCAQTPKAGTPISGAPELTVDRSCDSDDEASVPAETTTTTTEQPEATETTVPAVVEEVLTVDNNPDLAAILTDSADCSDTYAAFSTKYRGRTIDFAGHITALANHGDYTTRYDILIAPGDFGSSQLGPNFQYRDVNTTSDLHFEGAPPAPLTVGTNLRFVATVGEFTKGNCLLQLDPVSTAAR